MNIGDWLHLFLCFYITGAVVGLVATAFNVYDHVKWRGQAKNVTQFFDQILDGERGLFFVVLCAVTVFITWWILILGQKNTTKVFFDKDLKFLAD